MKKEYISPELTFIKVQAQDILNLSENDIYVDADGGYGGIFG